MKHLDPETLATIHGGLRWQEFRPSTNVEDRRSPAAIRKQNEWWAKQHATPLPPPRPEGL